MIGKLLLISAAFWSATICQNIHFPEASNSANRTHGKTGQRTSTIQTSTYQPSSNNNNQQYSTTVNNNRQYLSPAQNNGQSSSPVYNNGQSSSPVYNNGQSSSPVYNNAQYSSPVYNNGQSSSPVYNNGQSSSPVYNNAQYSSPVYNNGQSSSPVYNNGQSSSPVYNNAQYSTTVDNKRQYNTPANNLQYVPPRANNNEPVFIGPKQGVSNMLDKMISRGVLQMTLQMDRIISPEATPGVGGENVVFSPTSIAMTLALVMLGSGGTTLREVSRVLGLEGGLEQRDVVHGRFGDLLSRFEDRSGGDGGTRTTLATAVFVQMGFPLRNKYLSVSRNVYKSDILSLDFVRNNAQAEETINRWVEFRTDGRIKGFLNEPPSPATRVLLASALYFNGQWEHPFPLETTKTRPFYVTEPLNGQPGETIQVTMMANAVELPYHNDAALGCQVVTLPYQGRQLAMHVVLPNERGHAGLHALKAKLSVSGLESLVANTRPTSTIVSLPRMKLSSTINLKPTLISMGLGSLFIPGLADLRELASQGNLTGTSALYADDVLHKVEIEVTETGTVASAVTALTVSRSGNHRTVRMDRPFLFFIRHEVSKLVLFWGAVVRPA